MAQALRPDSKCCGHLKELPANKFFLIMKEIYLREGIVDGLRMKLDSLIKVCAHARRASFYQPSTFSRTNSKKEKKENKRKLLINFVIKIKFSFSFFLS